MTNPLKTSLFLGSSLLFIMHQLLQKVWMMYIPFADAYLDNLLAMPIILSLFLAERKYVFKQANTYKLSLKAIILTTGYIAVVSECIFPHLSPRFRYDPLDFVFYYAGAGLYLLSTHYQRRSVNNQFATGKRLA